MGGGGVFMRKNTPLQPMT